MTRTIDVELVLAVALSLERSQCDMTRALALMRESGRDADPGVEQLLARTISRLEMMRMALGPRDARPILT
jgi:hypothetical protein